MQNREIYRQRKKRIQSRLTDKEHEFIMEYVKNNNLEVSTLIRELLINHICSQENILPPKEPLTTDEIIEIINTPQVLELIITEINKRI